MSYLKGYPPLSDIVDDYHQQKSTGKPLKDCSTYTQQPLVIVEPEAMLEVNDDIPIHYTIVCLLVVIICLLVYIIIKLQ